MENFVDKLLISSINHMKTNEWQWPEHWDLPRKRTFLQSCLTYAEQNELFEQCAIIRDVSKELE